MEGDRNRLNKPVKGGRGWEEDVGEAGVSQQHQLSPPAGTAGA